MQCGADAAWSADDLTPALLQEAFDGLLADIVVLCTGAPAVFSQAVDWGEPGGGILLFALPEPGREIPLRTFDLWNKGIRLVPTYAGPPAETLTALELMRSGRVAVEDLVTHRLPLTEAARGFELAASGRDCLKVVLEPRLNG